MHPVYVFRAGFDADEDDLLALAAPPLRVVGVEHHLAGRRPWRGGQPPGNHLPVGLRVERRVQQLVQRRRIDPHHRGLLVDQPFADHVDSDLQCRSRGPLAAARLQHIELALLDRELDVLHVAVMRLQASAHVGELAEDLGHDLFHGRQGRSVGFLAGNGQMLRRPDACDHVLALRVDQIFTVELVFAGRGITGERHAGRAVLAHVAEHHGLHVHRGAPVLGNVVQPAIGDRARDHPALEHGADRTPELLVRILWKRRPELVLHARLVGLDQRLQIVRSKMRVERDAAVLLVELEDLLEIVVLHAKHDVTVHLDEAAIAVIGEARVAAARRKPQDGFVVETQVQHGIHHAGHRHAGAGPYGDE